MVGYIVYTNTRSRDICDMYYSNSSSSSRRSLVLGSTTTNYNAKRRLWFIVIVTVTASCKEENSFILYSCRVQPRWTTHNTILLFFAYKLLVKSSVPITPGGQGYPVRSSYNGEIDIYKIISD